MINKTYKVKIFQKSLIFKSFVILFLTGLSFTFVYKAEAAAQKASGGVSLFEQTKKSAEAGDIESQAKLGEMYYTGNGVKKDYGEAFSWFSQAAENGNADAQYMLGELHIYGFIGYVADFMYVGDENKSEREQKALEWYKKAAAQGHKKAKDIIDRKCEKQFQLAEIYFKGGALKEALVWYEAAAELGSENAQEMLLKLNKDDILMNIQDRNGRTALLWASLEGVKKIVEMSLKAGADPNVKDDDGCTALIFASQNGYKEIIEILLEAKADINLQDKYGRTALMCAVGKVNGFNSDNQMVEALLNAGANPNLQMDDGKTALMLASEKAAGKTAEMLLNSGAVQNFKDKNGYTALMYALEKKYNGDGMYDGIVYRLLKAKTESSVQDIIVASAEGDIKTVDILLKAGTNPNLQSEYNGMTALMWASFTRHEKIVELLLNTKADTNLQDKYGKTALIRASGRKTIIEMLLKYGADPNKRDNKGKTALSYAENLEYSEIADMLKKAGAKE